MKRSKWNNQGLIAWLLMLTLLFVALPSGASWQCWNGTPCPQDCPMLAQGGNAAAKQTAFPAFHCARCRPVSTLAAPTQVMGHCPLSQCVLRVQSKPDAAITHKITFALPLLALPPPPVTPSFAVSTVEPVEVSFPSSPVFYPQKFMRPNSSRAPPVLL